MKIKYIDPDYKDSHIVPLDILIQDFMDEHSWRRDLRGEMGCYHEGMGQIPESCKIKLRKGSRIFHCRDFAKNYGRHKYDLFGRQNQFKEMKFRGSKVAPKKDSFAKKDYHILPNAEITVTNSKTILVTMEGHHDIDASFIFSEGNDWGYCLGNSLNRDTDYYSRFPQGIVKLFTRIFVES